MRLDSIQFSKKTGGIDLTDHSRQPDMARMRQYRLARVQAELRARDYVGILLYDPVNIRYATGTRNMTVWTMHNAARYCFVPAEGKAVLFDYRNCEHLSAEIETVGEIRRGTFWYYFTAGSRQSERVSAWAKELADVVQHANAVNKRLAVDHVDGEGRAELERHGLGLFNGQEVMEFARCIKSVDELACMSVSNAVCEAGLGRIRSALQPGVTENQLWAILNHTNTEFGGEYIETRLLNSGGRTNPWFQEASDRIVRAGELVAIDTDMIGPFGYNADMSRTFFCGPGRPTAVQRTIYKLAHEQVNHNMALIKPGLSFRELAEKAWRPPERFAEFAANVVAHGIGMCNEYPQVAPFHSFSVTGYDGEYKAGMTICLEAYIGEKGGDEGVKLEQMVLVTESGHQLLTTFPFEEELLQ